MGFLGNWIYGYTIRTGNVYGRQGAPLVIRPWAGQQLQLRDGADVPQLIISSNPSFPNDFRRTSRVTYSSTTNPISSTAHFVHCDVSGGSITLTLPVIDGKIWRFKVTGWAATNAVTLQGATGNIDGAASNNAALNDLYDSCTVECDGTDFWIY
jgi:hypothetical protein